MGSPSRSGHTEALGRFIQQFLGHAKLDTTSIYTEISIDALKAVPARTHPAERPKEP